MNILVVTPFYKHDKNIASVRWTNISQRLSKNHTVFVVTQPFDDMDETVSKTVEDGIAVARINQKTSYEMVAVKKFGGATGDDWQTSKATTSKNDEVSSDDFKRKTKNALLFSAMKSKAKKYADEIVKTVIPKDTKIDVVISSACPFIEMLFGYELKKRLKCKWISDFRDLPFYNDNCDSTHRMKKIMTHCLSNADAVITIANKGVDVLASQANVNKDKIHVITNGFSMADAKESTSKKDEILHIVHTGSLYSGRRRADLLFKAMLSIKKEHPEFKIILECAGGNSEGLKLKAEEFGVISQITDHGFIPREEALELQNSADCLLALAENIPGSLPAKLFEYILCKKPIVCITCGDVPDSESTYFIKDLNLGFACEETDNLAEDKLKDYLICQCQKKKNGENLEYNPDLEKIKQFDHDEIVKKVEQLCYKVINER